MMAEYPSTDSSEFQDLDSVIDQAFGAGTATEEEETAPGPTEPEDVELDESEARTTDEDSEFEEEYEDDDEEFGEEELDDDEEDEEEEEDVAADDDEDLEEDEDEEEPEEEEEEDEEDVFTSVSAEELEEIEKNPTLKKLRRSMQADYTRKSQAVKRREEEVETFVDTVRTPEGMAGFLKNLMQEQREIVGMAFEAVATGDRAKDFLVEVGLEKPEVFEDAYDRIHELLSDEDARQRHVEQREIEAQKAELKETQNRIRRQNFDRDYDSLVSTVQREAQRLGIPSDDLKEVQTRLNGVIKGKVDQKGRIGVTKAKAKEVVREYQKELERVEQRVLKRHKKKQVKQSREQVKRKARKSKSTKRQPPTGRSRKPTKEKQKFQPPKGSDPLDSYIDHRLSG